MNNTIISLQQEQKDLLAKRRNTVIEENKEDGLLPTKLEVIDREIKQNQQKLRKEFDKAYRKN